MKKIISLLLLCLVLSLSLVLLVSCGEPSVDKDYIYDGHSLIGKWREEEYDPSFYQTYEFTSDGKVICKTHKYGIDLQSLSGTYKVDDNNKLIISYSDGITDTNPFSIDRGGKLTMQILSSENFGYMCLVPYDLEYNLLNDDIIGSWESVDNKNEIFTFNKDYTGSIKGGNEEYFFTYSLNGNELCMCVEFVPGFKDEKTSFMLMEYTAHSGKLVLFSEIEDKNGNIQEKKIEFERIK